jgi:hypothetical protein
MEMMKVIRISLRPKPTELPPQPRPPPVRSAANIIAISATRHP